MIRVTNEAPFTSPRGEAGTGRGVELDTKTSYIPPRRPARLLNPRRPPYLHTPSDSSSIIILLLSSWRSEQQIKEAFSKERTRPNTIRRTPSSSSSSRYILPIFMHLNPTSTTDYDYHRLASSSSSAAFSTGPSPRSVNPESLLKSLAAYYSAPPFLGAPQASQMPSSQRRRCRRYQWPPTWDLYCSSSLLG